MNRVIVTGANGFVGSAVAKELSAHGVQVWTVVRNEASDITSIANLPNVNIVYCELSEMEQLPQKISDREFDVFYHFAWDGVSGKARGDVSLQIENISGIAHAVVACAKLQCKRFIGIGTLAQYDCLAYTPEDGSMPLPTSCYASAKIAAYHFSKVQCVALGLEHIWVYLSNLYGVGDHSNNFVNFAIDSIMNNPHPAFTDGMQLYDFLNISDACRGLLLLGERGHSLKSYYVGSGQCRRLREYIEIIHQRTAPNKKIYLGEIPFKGRSVDSQLFNCDKLFLDTGFKPEISFETGIDELLAWRRKEI